MIARDARHPPLPSSPARAAAAAAALAVAAAMGAAAGCEGHRLEALSPQQRYASTDGGGASPGLDGGSGASTGSCVFGGGGAMGGMGRFSINVTAPEGAIMAADPPPPITGGTMIVLHDGVTAVAADPDRDRVFVVDLADMRLRASIPLTIHDEPGRLVEDLAGQVHVVLRRAGALVTIDPGAGRVVARRPVCAVPRGIAYEAARDRLHVACAGGELVTFTPTDAAPVRTVQLPRDLRDVVVDGDQLLVTRFRAAELLVVSAAGVVVNKLQPPTFASPAVRDSRPFSPTVAWRAIAAPSGGALMLHQRGLDATVNSTPGGYGGFDPCGSIVHVAVTRLRQGELPVASPALPGLVLPVDMAVSPDGSRVAMVAAGNGPALVDSRLFVARIDDIAADWAGGCAGDGVHGPSRGGCSAGAGGAGGAFVGAGGQSGSADGGAGATSGIADGGPSAAIDGRPVSQGTCVQDVPAPVQPVSVAFTPAGAIVVQGREPAELWINLPDGSGGAFNRITLSSESRADTGHLVFHQNSGGGLACASCHPEGREDGRVWDFQCERARRTQSLLGGIGGTEPFHWSGDLKDFSTLMNEVFVGRMSGPLLSDEQVAAVSRWVDSIPALPPPRAAGDPQVESGRALFQSAGCALCHAGARFTSNASVTAGTGGVFQIPSLRGVAWRAPYMHNGCAQSLEERFSNRLCGGGDYHGKTSSLGTSKVEDLIAYLESL